MPTMSPKKGSQAQFVFAPSPALFTLNGMRVSAPQLFIFLLLVFGVVRYFSLPTISDQDEFGTSDEARAMLHRKTFAAQRAPPTHRPRYEEAVAAAEAVEGSLPTWDRGASGMDLNITLHMQVLSMYPRIQLFRGLMSAEQCRRVIALAQDKVQPSALELSDEQKIRGMIDVRTSDDTFLSSRDDPNRQGVLRWMEDVTAAITGIAVDHSEPFNVLRYQPGQHYYAHFDYLDDDAAMAQHSQRVATLMFYLSDVEEGGETIFPYEGKQGLSRIGEVDTTKCDIGLKYTPRMGDALLFWSQKPDGTFDRRALHGGCPVIRGEKWVATKWLRDRRVEAGIRH